MSTLTHLAAGIRSVACVFLAKKDCTAMKKCVQNVLFVAKNKIKTKSGKYISLSRIFTYTSYCC